MVMTRANVEVLLIRRCGALMTAAGLDGTTVDGTNVDLNDPIGVAIVAVSGTVASRVLVTATDVATVAAADYDEFLDVVEYRVLESVLGNLGKVDITVGPRQENLSQLATRLEKTIERKRKDLHDKYGYAVGTLEAGYITLDFAEHDEESTDSLGW